jgi:ethanolaminephosphotransferase
VLGFYAATWEEYYTGELSLPVINGPNEGIVITCLIHIFTGIVGPDFWLTESSWFK